MNFDAIKKMAAGRPFAIISASQISNYLRCPRRWFGKTVIKLPTLKKRGQKRGVVLHDVVERLVQTPPHEVPLLFPEGWAEGLTGEDRSLIETLVNEARAQGLLRQNPAVRCEHEFTVAVVDEDEGLVLVTGFLDAWEPGVEIVDYKTQKNARYCASRNKLEVDNQALLYAYISLLCNEWTPEFAHLNFVFDPKKPAVRKTPVKFTEERVVKWATETLLPVARNMLYVRTCERYSPFTDIDGPEEGSNACRDYGGCDFLTICTSQESVKDYEARIAWLSGSVVSSNKSSDENQNGGALVSLFEKPNPFKAGGLIPGQQPQQAQPAQAAPAVNPTPAVVAAKPAGKPGAPPWTNPACGACEGLGFQTAGPPCPMCTGIAQSTGKPSPAFFDVGVSQDGASLTWAAKEGMGPALQAMQYTGALSGQVPNPRAPVKVEVQPVLQAAPVQAAPVQAAPVQAAPVQAAPTTHQEAPPAAAYSGAAPATTGFEVIPKHVLQGRPEKGRPPKTFTLYVGCTPTKGVVSTSIIEISAIVAHYGQQMAEANGKGSFWELNAFSRRDALCSKVLEILDSLAGEHLVVLATSPDVDAFVAALEPLASTVIRRT